MAFKYGRRPAHPESTHPRVHLRDYLPHEVKAAYGGQRVIDWASRVAQWPMYLNDKIGDCTCAGAGHLIQALTTYGPGATVTVADADVLSAYEALSGYNPSTGANDNGANEQDVLSYWEKTGIGGHHITAFASVNVADEAEMRVAMRWFGGVYIGVNVPQSAQDQFSNGQPWAYDASADNSILGGHAIVIQEWDTEYLRVVTWGQLQPVTWEWMAHFGEEAWVVVTPDFLEANGLEGSGISAAQLVADFKNLGGGITG